MKETILILANSRKFDGRCIAGKDSKGNWIRLVQEGKRSIPKKEGKKINIMSRYNVDIIENLRSLKLTYHTENYTYDNLEFLSNADINDLDVYLDNPEYIYGDTRRFIKYSKAKEYDNSLMFVKVKNFVIYKTCDDKLRCNFIYNDKIYQDICVTESNLEKMFKKREIYCLDRFDEAYITISIGIPNYGNVFKLVSGFIPIS